MNLHEIVTQLESCHYECPGGPLEKNVAFIALKWISQDAELRIAREVLEWISKRDPQAALRLGSQESSLADAIKKSLTEDPDPRLSLAK